MILYNARVKKNLKIRVRVYILIAFLLIAVFVQILISQTINSRSTQMGSKADTVSSTPTPTSTLEVDLKIRLQGITKQPAETINSVPLTVTLLTLDSVFISSQTAEMKADNQGIFSGTVSFHEQPGNYYLGVKGPKYLQTIFTCPNPVSSDKTKYSCGNPANDISMLGIELKSGTNMLDFSHAYLMAGDLQPQDGVLNANDLSLIRNNFGNTDPSILSRTDLNLDGKIDTQDWSLALYTLSVTNSDDQYTVSEITPTPSPTAEDTPTTTPVPTVTPSYTIQNDTSTHRYSTNGCIVDYSQATDLEQAAERIVRLCQDSYGKIAQKLKHQDVKLPITFILNATQAKSLPGVTSGSVINLSAEFFRTQTDPWGVAIHELTHAVQNYPNGGVFWINEGIADYIRYWMGYQAGSSYAHCPPGTTYASGYWCSAAFLQFVEKNYDQNILPQLDAVLSTGTYADSIFTQETGKDLSSLWNDCLGYDCKNGSP